MRRRMRRSASTLARTPGRRILRTTGVPSWSFARCTCAMEAEPWAVVSRSRNTSNGERPRERSSSGSSASNGTGGTSLWSFSSSAIQAGGRRSTRVAITCPSFTNVGPRSSSAMRMRAAGSSRTLSTLVPQLRACPARSSTLTMPMRWTRSPRPWRMKTEVISWRRGRSPITPTVFCNIRAPGARRVPPSDRCAAPLPCRSGCRSRSARIAARRRRQSPARSTWPRTRRRRTSARSRPW
jgi:hypothetical protein